MSAKPVTFKKRAVAGACRAMRCKICEPEQLYEFDTGDPKIGVALLCEGHWRRAEENKTAPAPVGPSAGTTTAVVAMDNGVLPEDEVQPDGPLIGTVTQPTPDQTAVVVPHAPVRALVDPLRTEYIGMAQQLVGFAIGTQEQVDMAGALLKQVNGKMAKLKKQRLDITRPMLEAKAAVDALFRPAEDAAKSVVVFLKDGIRTFVDAQQAAQVAALEAGNHEAGLAVVQPTMPAGVSTRTVWKWRITNENLIPREFWVIDSAKVQAHVNTNKGNSAIPGVEAYCETGISASTSG